MVVGCGEPIGVVLQVMRLEDGEIREEDMMTKHHHVCGVTYGLGDPTTPVVPAGRQGFGTVAW